MCRKRVHTSCSHCFLFTHQCFPQSSLTQWELANVGSIDLSSMGSCESVEPCSYSCRLQHVCFTFAPQKGVAIQICIVSLPKKNNTFGVLSAFIVHFWATKLIWYHANMSTGVKLNRLKLADSPRHFHGQSACPWVVTQAEVNVLSSNQTQPFQLTLLKSVFLRGFSLRVQTQIRLSGAHLKQG